MKAQSQQLELELEAFRKQMTQAKALRKQHEVTLAEVTREKSDVSDDSVIVEVRITHK